MEKINLKELAILVVRLCIAGAFILAALPKIEAPTEFASAIQGYQTVPAHWALWIAISLPWLELVCGVGLVLPHIRRGSAIVLAALLILFIGLHISALVRGIDISCGCFGLDQENKSNLFLLIARNLALLLGSIIVFYKDHNSDDSKTT